MPWSRKEQQMEEEKLYIYLIEGDIIPEDAEIRIMGTWVPIKEFLNGQRIGTLVGHERADFKFRTVGVRCEKHETSKQRS